MTARRRAGAKGWAIAPAFGQDGEHTFAIGDLAREFGVTPRAIRLYEERGLISPTRVGQNRCYTRRDRARLILILRGKTLGFSLQDIAEFLALYDADPCHLAQTRHVLDRIELAIENLLRMRADLDQALRDFKGIRASCLVRLRSC